jgi:hypothetical protein
MTETIVWLSATDALSVSLDGQRLVISTGDVWDGTPGSERIEAETVFNFGDDRASDLATVFEDAAILLRNRHEQVYGGLKR